MKPSKFNDELKELMLDLYEKGATDQEVADQVGVSRRTICRWKAMSPDFNRKSAEAKDVADDLVEASLFDKATGYSHPEEKHFMYKGEVVRVETVKHYPPDTVAAIFWLKNRRPEVWREKQKGEDDMTVRVTKMSDDELNARLAELLGEVKAKQKTENE